MKTTMVSTFSITIESISKIILLLWAFTFVPRLDVKAQKLTFKSLDRVQISGTDSIGRIIVLKNNLSCMNCFYVVDECLKKLKDELDFTYCIGTFSDSSLFDRRRNTAYTKRYLPNAAGYFTYESDEATDSILNIKYTPALILINESDSLIIPYVDLLDISGTTVPIEIQKKIKHFLE